MRRACVRLLVMTALVATPSAAHAADEVEVSLDGVTWSRTLPRPLFATELRWVPGDRETATFYVRNAGRSAGDLSIAAVGHHDDGLIERRDIVISARGEGSPWRAVDEPGTHRLLSSDALAGGRTARVDVQVAFAPGSTNRSEVRSLALDLDVRLVQHDRHDGAAGGGLLPGTGGPAAQVLLAGLILSGAGLVLVRRSGGRAHV